AVAEPEQVGGALGQPDGAARREGRVGLADRGYRRLVLRQHYGRHPGRRRRCTYGGPVWLPSICGVGHAILLRLRLPVSPVRSPSEDERSGPRSASPAPAPTGGPRCPSWGSRPLIPRRPVHPAGDPAGRRSSARPPPGSSAAAPPTAAPPRRGSRATAGPSSIPGRRPAP